MHFNIYIDDQTGSKLTNFAKKSGKTRNALIREALQEWVTRQTKPTWSAEILSFKGISDFPPFEQTRQDLKPPKEDPFA